MKKIFSYFVSFLFFSTYLVFAQVPADQDTIVIDGGITNIGSLENTINGDTLTGAVRINPNRVYKLKKDTWYYVQAPILFGSDQDTTSTLNIVGETGGTLPVILSVPLDGGNAFIDQIYGNFTIKNVYWEAAAQNGTKANLFIMHRQNRRLIMENVVTEFGGNDLITLSDHGAKIYMKNCYLRDMNRFQNSWNSSIVANNGADTVWVENCSITNPGLGFFLLNTVNFAYFNHNTFVNATKYGITKEQYLKGYFVNNIWINMNWEGECSGTQYTQNDDHLFKGICDVDTVDPALWQSEQGFTPDEESVKILISNDVHFTDTCFNKYYRGEFTQGFNYPVSSRNWAPWATDSTNGDIRVNNIPPRFFGDMTINLAKGYNNIVLDNNTLYDGVDPKLHTETQLGWIGNGVRDATALENFAYFSEANYATAPEGQTFDPAKFTFGDYDPTTIPGNKTEDGDGITSIRDLTEDFSYDANLVSTIDGKKLGALGWWADGLDGWDSQAEFAKVEAYYNKLTGVERTNNNLPSNYNLAQNYPNPFNPSTTINFSIPKSSNVKIAVYNILGEQIAVLLNENLKAGNYHVTWNAANMASGTYFYRISTQGFTSTKKMLLLK